MALKKMVNGVEIELSVDEEAETLEEWRKENERIAYWNVTEKYKEDRKNEYPTIEETIVALWEKIIENRPESADALQVLRIKVKNKYPKPK